MNKDIKEEKKISRSMKTDISVCIFLVIILLLYLVKAPILKSELTLMIIATLATLTIIIDSIKELKKRIISVELLASIALIVSLIEKEWISAIFINLMITSAKVAGEYVKIRSHSAIRSLLKYKPKTVKIEINGKIMEIPIERVKKGDRIIIELGEMVPVDGIIVKGNASVDQSSLTGESIPVFKKSGDQILSFTTIVSGNIVMVAEKVGKETAFEKIISLVETSQLKKSPIHTIVSKFSNWYIALTLIGSIVVYLISKDVKLVLSLLLVSCADDIAVATPLALMSAITHAAKHGAIVKGGDFLEVLAKIKYIVFDKTGTLTKGKLRVEKAVAFKEKEAHELIKLAAAASMFSNHPIAHTITSYAQDKKILIPDLEDFKEFRGKGMTAVYKDGMIITGKLSFLKEKGVEMTDSQLKEILEEQADGFNVTLVAYNQELLGYIALADELRKDAKQTINELRDLGMKKIIMLTGDNEKIARKIADELMIDEFHANLLPEDKIKHVEELIKKHGNVAMVGDGINDAPTIALSNIGIAMGAIGSDAAIEAADIAMMKDDVSQIPEIIRISRSTMGVIKQNILIWGIVNVLGLALVFFNVLDPSGAAAYNFVTDFIPIVNSFRLFK